jgi:hypothetical protein
MPQNFKVTDLIHKSLLDSIESRPGLQVDWVNFSFRLAQFNKNISYEAQQLGIIDLLVRQLEDEYQPRIADPSLDFQLVDRLRSALSVSWIIGIYDVIRMAFQTVDGRKDDKLKSLYAKLELIRVPLSKREIAQDGKLSGDLKSCTNWR